MSLKRQPADDDDLPLHAIKAARSRGSGLPSDYSNDVRRKITASNRTGQACDRCRVSYQTPGSTRFNDPKDAMR
ncbi:MAG: hypothetical protein Q9214_003650 [Letrouitia sp. 1 TL-2023]